MNRMIISEEEKSRILEMHKKATEKQYLMEQATTQPQAGTTTQTTTQPQVGTTTQPETIGGGGETASYQERVNQQLQTFIQGQPTYVEDQTSKNKIYTPSIVKQMNNRLQFDGVSPGNKIQFRYVIQCVSKPNSPDYILDPNTKDTLFPLQSREFTDKGWTKWEENEYAASNIYPKKGVIGKFIANACKALVSTHK